MTRRWLTLLALAASPLCGVLHAIGPSYKTDEELARCPVIVVARWDRAAVRQRGPEEEYRDESLKFETRLQVLRVIKGPIRPGDHQLLVAWGVAWREDGSGLATWMSTHIAGDVEDVSQPAIWFLDRTPSSQGAARRNAWIAIGALGLVSILAGAWAIAASRARRARRALAGIVLLVVAVAMAYRASLHVWSPLQLGHYRAIQPLVLEGYFAALRSFRPESHVRRLLRSEEPEVVRRTLHYLCGWIWPWPYTPDEFTRGSSLHYVTPEKRGNVRRRFADAVRGSVDTTTGVVRHLAAAVYAELAGADSVPNMRSLLEDRDPSVRAVAAATLARHRDEASLPRMATALTGLEDPYLASMTIEALVPWGDARLAPALIGFLEDGRYGGQDGDDLFIPAVKARNGLHAITGRWMPFDVRAAREAWERIQAIGKSGDPDAEAGLALVGMEFPLKAELAGFARRRPEDLERILRDVPPEEEGSFSLERSILEDGGYVVTVRVTNESAETITIPRYPVSLEARWPEGDGGCLPARASDGAATERHVRLSPSRSIEFEALVEREFLAPDVEDRDLRLRYAGKPWFEKAEGPPATPPTWFGWLPVRFGPLWKGIDGAE